MSPLENTQILQANENTPGNNIAIGIATLTAAGMFGASFNTDKANAYTPSTVSPEPTSRLQNIQAEVESNPPQITAATQSQENLASSTIPNVPIDTLAANTENLEPLGQTIPNNSGSFETAPELVAGTPDIMKSVFHNFFKNSLSPAERFELCRSYILGKYRDLNINKIYGINDIGHNALRRFFDWVITFRDNPQFLISIIKDYLGSNCLGVLGDVYMQQLINERQEQEQRARNNQMFSNPWNNPLHNNGDPYNNCVWQKYIFNFKNTICQAHQLQQPIQHLRMPV
jgi:hypothetical protein